MINKIKVGTFCSGIGSPEQALKELNINHSVEFACEIDKYARMTYQANHTAKTMYDDLTTIDYSSLPDVNLFVAGFPCQSFSIAGKRLGFEDTRGTIFFHILEYLKTKQPDVFILENVKGLLSHKSPDFNPDFDLIYNYLFLSGEFEWKKNIEPKELIDIAKIIRLTGGVNGLIKNLKSLLKKNLLITKKGSYFPIELIQVSGLNVEEWGLNLKRLYSIDNISHKDILLLESLMDTIEKAVPLLKIALEEKLRPEKLYTILTETKWTTDLQTYISALQELSITLFIIKQWKLSTNLWKEIKLFSKTVSISYVQTFDVIINSLASTVNGQCLMFPNADTLGYNVHYQVLNAKDYGIPQNRERIFIVGFKNNQSFNFPKKQELKLKLKDLLESNVDEKYYLSEKMIKGFLSKDNNFNGRFEPKTTESLIANTLTARCFKSAVTDNYIQLQKISGTNQGDRVYSVNGLSSCLGSNGGGGGAKTGLYAIPQTVTLTESRTETAKEIRRKFNKLGLDYSSRRDKNLSIRKDSLSNCITSNKSIESFILDDYRIRRLTPRECMRLMNFPDSFITPCSDTQTYKQAGNSIVVNVLKEIFKEIFK